MPCLRGVRLARFPKFESYIGRLIRETDTPSVRVRPQAFWRPPGPKIRLLGLERLASIRGLRLLKRTRLSVQGDVGRGRDSSALGGRNLVGIKRFFLATAALPVRLFSLPVG